MCEGGLLSWGDAACVSVTELCGSAIASEPLAAAVAAGPLVLHWQEVAGRGGRRKRALHMELVVENAGELGGSVCASLPGACTPARLDGTPLPLAELTRAELPRDATPNLPAALGAVVRFATVAAALPPRTRTRVCRCGPDADAPGGGFVYILGSGVPHPRPREWAGHVLGFPLGTEAPFLCTQGFGGRGHHRGPHTHHSADFSCAEGTPVLAVFDGTVVDAGDTSFVGGGHVDLLPECNSVSVQCAGSGIVAVYLHLAPLSLRVRVGAAVRRGDVIAATGNTGFSTGAHLHVQLNADGSGTEAVTVMWALQDARRGAVLPVAGHWYSRAGWQPPLAALERLRCALGLTEGARSGGGGVGGGVDGGDGGSGGGGGSSSSSSGGGGGSGMSAGDALACVREALLWLRPEPFVPPPEDAAPLEEQSRETAERCFPSLHTCLLANVLAPCSLLREGPASRFCERGSLPPVYLSCAMNFERDERGVLASAEVAIREHQAGAAEDATRHGEARFALDPAAGADWLGYAARYAYAFSARAVNRHMQTAIRPVPTRRYFLREFRLVRLHELWQGEQFLRNVDALPAPLPRGVSAYPVYSLRRSTLARFADDARASGSGGGCVVVYRTLPVDVEPFGMWLCWMLVGGILAVVDLQNGVVSETLAGAIAALAWDELPLNHVFFAPFLNS